MKCIYVCVICIYKYMMFFVSSMKYIFLSKLQDETQHVPRMALVGLWQSFTV